MWGGGYRKKKCIYLFIFLSIFLILAYTLYTSNSGFIFSASPICMSFAVYILYFGCSILINYFIFYYFIFFFKNVYSHFNSPNLSFFTLNLCCIFPCFITVKYYLKELSLWHKSDFLILISFQPNIVDHRYFKLWNLLDQIF